jgi:hypothetical protein
VVTVEGADDVLVVVGGGGAVEVEVVGVDRRP